VTPPVVTVAKGGRSFERMISLTGARRVEESLRRGGFDVHGVEVDHTVVERIKELSPAFVFVACHGRGGEDGTLQELLDMVGVRYTGSNAMASAICMDKALTKRLLSRAGIPTPAFHVLSSEAFRSLGAGAVLPDLVAELGLPVVVKPVGEGSSLGIKFVAAAEELTTAVLNALAYDDRILVERQVTGRELAVTVVGPSDAPEVLPIVELKPKNGFYSYEAHYSIGDAELHAPAELEAGLRERVEKVARSAYTTLGCRDFARVDLILDDDGEPQVLELNTIPGLTETGPTPFAADAGGWTFDRLVARVSERAAAAAGVADGLAPLA
jgi:D-alanine-D-alanine ligase